LVILAILLAFALILGVAASSPARWPISRRTSPEYQSTIIEKARSLRLAAGSSGAVEQAEPGEQGRRDRAYWRFLEPFGAHSTARPVCPA
jgi:hypothetical protein